MADIQLQIGGNWRAGGGGATLPVINPATDETIGSVAVADQGDLDTALMAAARGFTAWSRVPAFERGQMLRRAADLLRSRAPAIAEAMVLEQGKPLAEARGEVMAGADVIDWFAEETRRIYGRIVPGRSSGVQNLVQRHPVGVVAAFTPWNFPINQAVRKIAPALAAGCAIILKAPEETPTSCAELVRCFLESGIPGDALGLVFGDPAKISGYLIPHPIVRKVSFTGSTEVGKRVAALAGLHMKRATMELGGHAPAIVFDDADVVQAVSVLTTAKFRNAGQVCIAPTRLLVQQSVYADFVDAFATAAGGLRVGDGRLEDTQIGPLVHSRRVAAMEHFTANALEYGARVLTGGARVGNRGAFFAPTVLTAPLRDARIMGVEPFGPIAVIERFNADDEALAEANRLSYGLAAYAFTKSARRMARVGEMVEAGMIGINHAGIAFPELPFGGVKDSGYGSEGGAEGIEPYLITRHVSQLVI